MKRLKHALGLTSAFATFFIGTAGSIGEIGYCGGLFAPFAMDTAGVLPVGVRSVRLGGFTAELSEKYSGSGTVIPLANSFNKPVTWNQLIEAQPKGFDLDQFKGGLRSFGIDFNDVVGDSRGLVQTRLTTTVPVIAYGLTERMTVGIGLPVLYSNLHVSTGWSANPAFQAKLDQLSKQGMLNKVLSYQQQLRNVVDTKIAGYGYKPLEDQKNTDLGDTTLAVKYLAYKSTRVAFALAPKIVVPTGRTADVDKVVDISAGDGQWDLGLGGVMDVEATNKLKASLSTSYTHQLASTKAKRVPLSRDESLSPDRDENVQEKLGDIASASLGMRYQLLPAWALGAAYGFQYKAPDVFSGSKYEQARYEYLADDSEQSMQTATLGLSYSTVPLFRAQQFALPLDASINFSTVLAGRNVSKINLTAVELVSYF